MTPNRRTPQTLFVYIDSISSALSELRGQIHVTSRAHTYIYTPLSLLPPLQPSENLAAILAGWRRARVHRMALLSTPEEHQSPAMGACVARRNEYAQSTVSSRDELTPPS